MTTPPVPEASTLTPNASSSQRRNLSQILMASSTSYESIRSSNSRRASSSSGVHGLIDTALPDLADSVEADSPVTTGQAAAVQWRGVLGSGHWCYHWHWAVDLLKYQNGQ